MHTSRDVRKRQKKQKQARMRRNSNAWTVYLGRCESCGTVYVTDFPTPSLAEVERLNGNRL
jgi:hypothetical protein